MVPVTDQRGYGLLPLAKVRGHDSLVPDGHRADGVDDSDDGIAAMLISDLAFRDVEYQSDLFAQRCRSLLRRMFGISGSQPSGALATSAAAPPIHLVRSVATDAEPDTPRGGTDDGMDFRWRRHPQLRRIDGERTPPDGDERMRVARAAATRAMFLARSGRYDEARWAFAQAAADPDVDLAATPGFWNLTRAGMMSAVLGYEDADRIRDAAALGARIRIRFRPTAITPLPTAEEMARAGHIRRAAGG